MPNTSKTNFYLRSDGTRQYYIISKGGRRFSASLVKCLYCGKMFTKINSAIKRNPKHFCSYKCFGESRKFKGKQYFIKNGKRQYFTTNSNGSHSLGTLVTCQVCKKKFVRSIVDSTRRKLTIITCSHTCANKAREVSFSNGNSIIGDKGCKGSARKICKQYYPVIACECCGYSKYEKLVDAHHIDLDQSNNSKENLIWLCKMCHYAVHYGLAKLQQRQLKYTRKYK